MTELWTCTDCEAEVPFEDRHKHMQDEHGAMYAIPDPTCACSTHPCARAKALEG